MPASYPIPGLTLAGVVNSNVRELVTQFSAHLIDFLDGNPLPTWVDLVSNMTPTEALSLKVPINVLALDGFEEWTGERNYVDVDLVAMALEAKSWTRNLAYPMRAAMLGVYGGFDRLAASVVAAGYKMRPRVCANVLIKGKTDAKTYQGIPLFVGSGAATKHYVNPLDASKGTFFNLYTNMAFTPANLKLARQYMRQIKGPDGVESLGLELTHVLGGAAMQEPFDDVLQKQIIANTAGTAAETNTLEVSKSGIRSAISSLLDSDPWVVAGHQVWYGIATNTMGRAVEMMGLNGGAPKVVVRGDGSEIAQSKKSVLVEGDLEINGAAGLPHVIIRFEGP